MKPGQYFILCFDFSSIDHASNTVDLKLKEYIATSLEDFYDTYAMYLDGGASVHSGKINVGNPATSLSNCVKLVRQALAKGNKQLADIKGVRMDCSNLFCFTNS